VRLLAVLVALICSSWPAFAYDQLEVYCNACGQTTGQSAWQKVPLNAIAYDTIGMWDSTNKRAVPKKPGYYRVIVRSRYDTASSLASAIGFNGAQFKGVGIDLGNGNAIALGGGAMIYCNGTTDYIESWAFSNTLRTWTPGTNDNYMQIMGPF
jgi:hypothetical protein